MDLLVEENGVTFAKHYLIDFGAMFGSASILSNTARDGNAYFWELKPALAQMATLGIWSPRWMRDSYIKHPALGMIEYPSFEPEEWKPNYPNPAFQNRLPTDEFWAAKRVMAFSDAAITAIVKEAKFTDKYAEELLTDYLIKRCDKIGEAYFAKVLPLDSFKVGEGQLHFEDLQIKYGLVDDRNYGFEWSSFDNSSEKHSPIAGATGPRLPDSASSAASGSFHRRKNPGRRREQDGSGLSPQRWLRLQSCWHRADLVGRNRAVPARAVQRSGTVHFAPCDAFERQSSVWCVLSIGALPAIVRCHLRPIR